MNCTHCKHPIERGDKYYRTRKGAHHADCPIPLWAIRPGCYVMQCDCDAVLAFRIIADGNSVGGLAMEWAHKPGVYTALKCYLTDICPHCKRTITASDLRGRAKSMCQVFGVKLCSVVPVIK